MLMKSLRYSSTNILWNNLSYRNKELISGEVCYMWFTTYGRCIVRLPVRVTYLVHGYLIHAIVGQSYTDAANPLIQSLFIAGNDWYPPSKMLTRHLWTCGNMCAKLDSTCHVTWLVSMALLPSLRFFAASSHRPAFKVGKISIQGTQPPKPKASVMPRFTCLTDRYFDHQIAPWLFGELCSFCEV